MTTAKKREPERPTPTAEEVLRRMLNTPPTPHKPAKKAKKPKK